MKTLTSFQAITTMAKLFNFKRMSFLVSNIILGYSHHRYISCVFSHLPVYSKRLCTVHFDHDNNSINEKAYDISNSIWEIIADLGKPQEIAATSAVIPSSSESENYPNSSHAHLNQPSNNPETECETTDETQIIFSPPKSFNEPSAGIPIDFSVIQKPFIPSFRSPVDQPHHCKSLYEEKEDEQQHMRIIETRTKLAKAFIGERIEVLNMIQQLTGAKIVYSKGEAVNGKAMTKVVVTGMVVGVEKATRLLLELIQN